MAEPVVEQIIVQREELGLVLSREVEAALRTVPRHLFAPGVPLEQAYANHSIVTKRTERGSPLSSVSAPWVQAMMLGQLQVAPGQRVLEIGGGYNAALLRELVGPEGSVSTLDIDPEIADRALSCLTTAGYRDVRVLCADGEFGAAEYGPFDRIIVTVGTWGIPPAWVEQLAEGGRLVVPLWIKGLCQSWALERHGRCLVGRDRIGCGFVPMQGVGKYRSQSIPLHGGQASLWVGDQQADATALGEALSTPRVEAWSGVTVRKGEIELFGGLGLWLARLPEFCLLSAKQDAVDRGLVSPASPMASPALLDRDSSLAYRAKLRPLDAGKTIRELGAYAHGPHAAEVAERFVDQIRIWDRDHRHGPGPRLTVHPAGTPDGDLPAGLVIDRRHTRIVVSWPDHAE
ncbi:MAG: methyltransferase, FxLD system [Pseudonocardiales bacterium]|nr:methyltransferase, FxLD system [Pseudonocardiales bacterium]